MKFEKLINGRVKISCGGGGVSKNRRKINAPPPFILNLRVELVVLTQP